MWGMTGYPTKPRMMMTMTMDRMCENHRKLCFEMSIHPLDPERFDDEGGDKFSTKGENPAMNMKSVKQIGQSLRDSSARIERGREDR
jgi:hypothetical protein